MSTFFFQMFAICWNVIFRLFKILVGVIFSFQNSKEKSASVCADKQSPIVKRYMASLVIPW